VLDGYPRVLATGCSLAWPGIGRLYRVGYWVFLLIMIAGALLIFQYLTSHMRTLVDFAATVAFLSAPLFAYLNYRVISGGSLPAEAIPPKWLLLLSWAGLVFLVGFSVLYVRVRFG
jgi:Mn2+/Fe2+ NRAMP family transporter